MAFFWVCNNSPTRQRRAGITHDAIILPEWHSVNDIWGGRYWYKEKTCWGTTLLNETPNVWLHEWKRVFNTPEV